MDAQFTPSWEGDLAQFEQKFEPSDGEPAVVYGDPVAFDGEFSDVTLAQNGNAAVILRVWRVS